MIIRMYFGNWMVFTPGLIFILYSFKIVIFVKNRKFCTFVLNIFSFGRFSSQFKTQLKCNPNTFHGCDHTIAMYYSRKECNVQRWMWCLECLTEYLFQINIFWKKNGMTLITIQLSIQNQFVHLTKLQMRCSSFRRVVWYVYCIDMCIV